MNEQFISIYVKIPAICPKDKKSPKDYAKCKQPWISRSMTKEIMENDHRSLF